MYFLEPIHDTRKSFYKKAYVEVQKNDFEQSKDLYSYGTLVASTNYNYDLNVITYTFKGKYSQTTTRHQKEFFKQQGLNDDEIKQLFKNYILVKEVIV